VYCSQPSQMSRRHQSRRAPVKVSLRA
jgi:hypothetical protein